MSFLMASASRSNRDGDQSHAAMSRTGWVLRPALWFTAASILTTILHEFAHVCTAFALGVRSTLFNYHGIIDATPAQAATNLPAVIRVAGPAACLVFGFFAWLGYRRAQGSPSELPLLYFSVFGVGTFFGNLMSASFVGDFSTVSEALHLPMTIRYMLTAIGAIGLAGVHFAAGRLLARWVPSRVGRSCGMLGVIAFPVVLGTAVVVLINWPMPAASVSARTAEASFWLFAGMGALSTKAPHRVHDGLRWVDGVVILLAALVVRLMVRGIPFVP